MKRSACKDRPEFQAMQEKRHMRRTSLKPGGKKLNIRAPILEVHLIENAGALSNAAVVVPKNFNLIGGQKSSPANPWEIGIVPLRGERTDKQDSRYRILDLVQHSVKVRARHLEISGMLRKLIGELN